MDAYKKEFIEFMVDCQVLKFGDFVTKSGRKTPFFVNTGFYRTGAQLRKLGGYYAEAIKEKFGLDFDVLFGPAYKGIPLSVAATIAISEKVTELLLLRLTATASSITLHPVSRLLLIQATLLQWMHLVKWTSSALRELKMYSSAERDCLIQLLQDRAECSYSHTRFQQ